MHVVYGVSVLLGALSLAGAGLGYLSDQFGEAVDESGNGALKIATAGAGAVAVYYAWGKL